MKTTDADQNDILKQLREVPDLVGREFDSQEHATEWTRRLAVSGYPAKRRGRKVWFSTDDLQPAAIKMAIRFGFDELDVAVSQAA